MSDTQHNHDFSIWRSLRLSSFQIGSAMSDILTASVWNRVMIADLGMPATPVGLLLALQYILLPISFWAGHRSDTHKLWGRRRISYIWLGRGLMVLAMPLLGVSVRLFEAGDAGLGWLLAAASFLLFGVGKLFSGSVYLALVRESAPPARQGLAVSMAETTLIAFFPLAAVGFGRWMEVYDPRTFAAMILLTAVVGGFFWWFSIFRAETKTAVAPAAAGRGGSWSDVLAKFRTVWQDKRVRRFFAFLFVATFAAWMQDNVMEPYGADVFGMEAGQTTRFTGYWGMATVLVLVVCFIVWRKRRPERQAPVTKVGLGVMAAGMVLLSVSAVVAGASLLLVSLVVFGAGFGLFSFGGFSLMAVMSPDRDAGAYLGLWTVCVLLSKGLGTFIGGALRDLFFLVLDWSSALSYALIFGIAGVGLIIAALILSGSEVLDFTRDHGRQVETAVLRPLSAD